VSLLRPPRRLRLLHILTRLLLLAAALTCVYFSAMGAVFIFRERSANSVPQSLSRVPAPIRSTRLLVFAPHCDDETLGCAGLAMQTLQAGGAVRVAIITNGDGFRAAVERQVRDLTVRPEDYIRFAALRQQESYRALGLLGIPRSDVLFFGYPDQGLKQLWTADWSRDHPFTSRYTRRSSSPYAITFDPRAVYCGHDLIEDIKTSMRQFRPTLVAVTHPAEDHPDHAAAASFVQLALAELQADPREIWSRQTQLKFYLVHRGDWPLPQGRHLDLPLGPPAAMAHVDTHWTTLPLTPRETRSKLRSIGKYASQMALMGRFLNSFARSTELLGDMPNVQLPVAAGHAITVDSRSADWSLITPLLVDPLRDNVLRDLQGGGDIVAVYGCRRGGRLCLRLDARRPIGGRIQYGFTLRAIGTAGQTATAALALSVRGGDEGSQREHGLECSSRGRTLLVSVPWRELEQECGAQDIAWLSVEAETSLGGVSIDRTGTRLISVGSEIR
jgi:LmbE family N-acetylglucosaminyl deacetylase